MKWKDLSLKERKQIYDSVRVNNPDATYFDIKEQFDSIPTYEDGIMLTNTDKGYVDWKSKLASNLKSETYGYDLYGAYKSGAQQQLEDDGYYHLPTRDPKTNKILKYPSHNTFWLGITEDIKQGYYPQVKDGRTYTVPAYEDGKGKTINKADLPPEYRTGTPEYFERQRKISGAVNAVQPEAYITPAGYIKDAVNFIEDLGKGDYAGAAIDAALNLIPWGVGKTIKKIKKKVGRAIEGTDAYTAESYAEPFTPTITKKKKGKKVKTEADYDQEFAEVKRKYNNMQEYDKELSKITNDLFMPTDGSVETLEKVDKAYGTNYKKAASAIAFQDMANRGKYVKHQQMYDSAGNPIYGRTTGKVDQPTIEDMTISLNPDYYLEGTANHEISHLADALVNRVHNADATNNYMEYLLDRDNIMSYNEIRQSLMDVNPNTYRYLTTPSENKAHMIQLKRGMQKEGLINNWTDPITQDKIEEYLSYRSKYANRVNPVLRTLYDIRPDKQGFINRMNNLTPIEWAVPLGLPMFFGEEQENK